MRFIPFFILCTYVYAILDLKSAYRSIFLFFYLKKKNIPFWISKWCSFLYPAHVWISQVSERYMYLQLNVHTHFSITYFKIKRAECLMYLCMLYIVHQELTFLHCMYTNAHMSCCGMTRSTSVADKKLHTTKINEG